MSFPIKPNECGISIGDHFKVECNSKFRIKPLQVPIKHLNIVSMKTFIRDCVYKCLWGSEFQLNNKTVIIPTF